MAGPRLSPTDVAAQTFLLSNDRVLDESIRHRVRTRLEDWERISGRRVPWRSSVSPFAVLVSELLLQRTRYREVSRVLGVLLGRFPTASSLAAASPIELSRMLQPLGLTRRATVLVTCAQTLVERFNGVVPPDLDSLLSLPGVGNYVARATRCLAFGAPAGAIDSAIGRMLRRVFGLGATGEVGYDRELWALSEWLSGDSGPELFCGLVDVAGEICKTTPRCRQCPLAQDCSHAIQALRVA
jgi:A/G-specific adenine glycosylase